MDSREQKEKNEAAVELLEGVIPFRFLSTAEKKKLIRNLREYTFKKGDII
jgi:hypothetical protein